MPHRVDATGRKLHGEREPTYYEAARRGRHGGPTREGVGASLATRPLPGPRHHRSCRVLPASPRVDPSHHPHRPRPPPHVLELSQTGADKTVPTLVFTRRRDTALKLRAFEHGADDILRIPFLLSEIVARLYAVMRRTQGIEVPLAPRPRLDSVEIDPIEERSHIDDQEPISLTVTESTLLYLLAANAGSVVEREDIITSIWDGVVDIESNAVDSHIRDLRVKLGDTWPSSKFIETIPGKGYRWRHVSPPERPN